MWKRNAHRAASVATMGLLIACGNGSGAPAESAEPDPDPEPAWVTGVATHTEAQAERGRQVFVDVCSTCHALGDFRQEIFHRVWAGGTVEDLYEFLVTGMPYDAPGSLDPEAYADVIAFIFQENELPAGESELPPDPERLQEIELDLPAD